MTIGSAILNSKYNVGDEYEVSSVRKALELLRFDNLIWPTLII